jgi:hypothetical protein
LGRFWRVLQWKLHIYDPFGLFYSLFVYFTAFWYIVRPFGMLCGHM